MGRRSKETNPVDVIIVVIFLAVVGYFLLKWFLTILGFIIAGIIYFIGWMIKSIKELQKKKSRQKIDGKQKQEPKNDVSSSTSTKETSNSTPLVEPVQNNKTIKFKNSKEINKYKTKYDYLFESSIRSRGIDYYRGNRIVDYKRLKTKCTCISKGTEDYKTEIYIDGNGNYKNAKCTCPYYQDKDQLCKHIYGLLLKYCIEEKIPVIEEKGIDQKRLYQEIVDGIDSLKSLIDDVDSIYHQNEFDIEMDAIYSELDTYKKKLQGYENLKIVDISKETLDSINRDTDEVQNMLALLEDEIDDVTETYKLEQEEDFLFDEALETGLALHYLEEEKKKKEGKDHEKKRQSLKNVWGLSDSEIDLVEQGRYHPWNFEDDKEDLEEDDYHYEDDI